jgi:tryptophan synthase alpha chain
MGRIDDIFQSLRSVNMKAVMPFVCGGYPKPGQLAETLKACEEGGASIIEVGIPFSDPIADGPVIASAMHEALQAGVTPKSIFAEVAAARGNLGVGLVAMVSASIVYRMGGPSGFSKAAKDAGFDGLIVPDAPLEESGELRDAARAAGLSLSLLIAPTTPRERAMEIAKASTGFIYMLARGGITGEQSELPDVSKRVAALREVTNLPIACGFGISTKEHVAAVVKHADAAIVGSALVRRMGDAAKTNKYVPHEARAFVRELAEGLHA